MGQTYSAETRGMCSSCFRPYVRGTRVFADQTGKVRHAVCGDAKRAPSRPGRPPATYGR